MERTVMVEQYGLVCDGHCGAQIKPQWTRRAWRDAFAGIKMGWEKINGLDYCPLCAAKLAQAQSAAPAQKADATA